MNMMDDLVPQATAGIVKLLDLIVMGYPIEAPILFLESGILNKMYQCIMSIEDVISIKLSLNNILIARSRAFSSVHFLDFQNISFEL